MLIPRSMPPPETEEKGKKKAHSESPTQVLEGIELDEVVRCGITIIPLILTLTVTLSVTKPCYQDC